MFKNKVVLITGASRGIGKATAIKFGELGANVIVNYVRDENSANNVVQEIRKLGCNAISIQADISEKDEIDKLVELSLQSFGKIDILVNNAGIVYDREFEDITYNESLQILKTNMLAPLFLSQKIAPIMVKNGGGNIVNVSSTSGLHDFNPGTADYDMSKIALQSLTKDLSLKYATQNIRVNAVAPSWVNTDMNSDLPIEFVDTETDKYHLKRWAEPDEIADAIIYLAGDKSTYITGQVLIVDGGHC